MLGSAEKSGWQLAEEGMQVSFNFANQDWKEAANSALRHTAQVMPVFTVDDIHRALEKRSPAVTTPSASALGQIMRSAAKEGLIQQTGDFRCSSRPSRHSAALRVWKSLIFVGV
jgi:hypothetical protein